MITVQRATERRYDRRQEHEMWLMRSPDNRAGHLTGAFDALEVFKEDRIPPRGGVPSPWQLDAEVLTYVREGTLTYEDSLGRSGVVRAGEFQRMTTGRGIHYSETNSSRTGWAHVFQIWLGSAEGEFEPGHEQMRFSTATRRGGLCLVAAPDGRDESLCLHRDALIFSAILDRGQHITYDLLPERSAWLHVVQGGVTLHTIDLVTGDGASFAGERMVSFTANEESEILLLDFGEPARHRTGESER